MDPLAQFLKVSSNRGTNEATLHPVSSEPTYCDTVARGSHPSLLPDWTPHWFNEPCPLPRPSTLPLLAKLIPVLRSVPESFDVDNNSIVILKGIPNKFKTKTKLLQVLNSNWLYSGN